MDEVLWEIEIGHDFRKIIYLQHEKSHETTLCGKSCTWYFVKTPRVFFPQLSAPVQKVGVQLGENVCNSRKTSIHIKTPIKSSMYYNVGGTIETDFVKQQK